MKLICVALLLLVFVSCTKTKINSPIVGSWSLDSLYVSICCGGRWEPAVTFAPTMLTFSSDGSFSQSNTIFNKYNHYQLISKDSILLYNSITFDELKVKYVLNNELTFYQTCIEGCAEKYKRK
jgi:hypothetical protein